MISPVYSAAEDRYDAGMKYRRSGKSGIILPEISLGLWQNFGDTAPLARSREDPVKAAAANIFKQKWNDAKNHPDYIQQKRKFQEFIQQHMADE